MKQSIFRRIIAVFLTTLLILTGTLAPILSAHARFIQADTWHPLKTGVGPNRYAYSYNDPINNSDPNGHFNVISGIVSGGINAVQQNLELSFGLRDEFSYSELAAEALLGSVTQGVSAARNAGKLAGLVNKAVRGGKSHKSAGCGKSFHGDTEVYADLGLKAIRDIKVGDLVWAQDLKSGALALKKVVHVFRQTHETPYTLTVKNDETGEESEIIASGNHRIFVNGRGWLEVRRLGLHDELPTSDKQPVRLVALKAEINTLDAYNLDVIDYDNFFVGPAKILVHNDEKPTPDPDGAPDGGKANSGGKGKGKSENPGGRGKKAADSGKNEPHTSKSKKDKADKQIAKNNAKIDRLKSEGAQKNAREIRNLEQKNKNIKKAAEKESAHSMKPKC